MEFGGGYSTSAGSSHEVQNDGWNYLMGGGYNFNRRLSLPAEYGLNLRSPQSEIDAVFGAHPTAPGSVQVIGDTHLWKLPLDPSYRFHQTEHLGLYVVAGGGFFRKLQIFRTEYNTCIGACGPPTPDLLRASNNAGGIKGGAGASWRPGTYSNARLFAEVRYVWVDNKPGVDEQFYAPADRATHHLLITVGLRWNKAGYRTSITHSTTPPQSKGHKSAVTNSPRHSVPGAVCWYRFNIEAYQASCY